jgi:signal transduction histidine kinase
LDLQQLGLQNRELVRLNQTKDELLACLGHELKTPLTAILGLSSLLNKATLGQLNDRQRYYTYLIHQSSRHLMDVVNDVLDLTRLETHFQGINPVESTLALHPAPENPEDSTGDSIGPTPNPTNPSVSYPELDLEALCNQAFAQAQQRWRSLQDPQVLQPNPLSSDPGAPSSTAPDPTAPELVNLSQLTPTYQLELASNLLQLTIDPIHLRQILTHLLTNALKLTQSTQQETIGVRVHNWNDHWLAFTVWDSGCGIPAAKQPWLFQKFLHLGLSKQVTVKGVELGLMLARRLAQIQGGDITFTSQEGKGSEFTLLLPSAVRTHPPVSLPKSGAILIGETDPRWIEHLKSQLDHLSYPTLVVRSMTELLEKAQLFHPDLLMLRASLPFMGDQQSASLWQSHPVIQGIPIVFTQLPQETDLATLLAPQPTILSLPTNPQILKAILEAQFPTFSPPSPCHLTLLCLRATPDRVEDDRRPKLPSQLPQLLPQHRVLEAHDLQQADLLARIWHPQVLLIDGDCCVHCPTYLQALQQYATLVQLPLITFDTETTKIANQIPELTVFPCLALEKEQSIPPQELPQILLPVIEVASALAQAWEG